MKTKNQAFAELKAMLPSVLVYNAVLLASVTAMGFAFGFDWRLYTGALAGNILFAANFLLIGQTALFISRTRDQRRGQSFGSISYGLRYVGMFGVLALLLSFRLISLFTAVIPLFYPKIYYTVLALRQKDDEI